jgi:predicted DNA-binding transcriptional regulator YafY
VGDTASRSLALLSLLQAPRAWSGSELAARLEVSRRTVRRDVDRLRDLGYPVEATMGAEGGYRLVAGTAMPPLLLDDDEATAIAFGLRSAADHPIEGIDEAAIRALAKLEQVLPARLRHRVTTLTRTTATLRRFGPTVSSDTLVVLAKAIANSDLVRFGYRALDRSERRRTAEPHRLVAWGRRWYLVAFDIDRDDWRLFRVDRISDPWPLRATKPRHTLPSKDAVTFVAERLLESAPTYRAVATLHAPIERVAPALDGFGEVEPIAGDRCRVTIDGDTLEWLAFRLSSVEYEFEVHEPPELIDHLRQLGSRILRAAPDTD